MKALFFISIILAIFSRFVLFNIKNEVVVLENSIRDISCSIAQTQEEICVLSSEWSYLTNPARVNNLVKRYLTKAQILKKSQLMCLPEKN
jgi:hypothetical protein